MSDISNAWRDILYDGIVRGINVTAPADVYLALFTAVSDDETGTEVADTEYARQLVSFGASTDGVGANDAEVAFPAAGEGFTATHGRLMDSLSGGVPLTKIKALASPKVVGVGDVLRFPIGNVSFEIL